MKKSRQTELIEYAQGIKPIPVGSVFNNNEVQFMLNAKLRQATEKAIQFIKLLDQTSRNDYPSELRMQLQTLAVINY